MRLGALCLRNPPSLHPGNSLEEALDLLLKSGSKVLVIKEGPDILGIVSTETIAAALRYDLPLSLGELISEDVPKISAEEEATAKKLFESISNPYRLALIFKGKKLLGLLTEEDLLLWGLSLPRPKAYQGKIAPQIRELLAKSYQISRTLKLEVYLVGGAVRDLLAGREFFDLDLVVSERIEEFAEALVRSLSATKVKHSLFATIKLRTGIYEIDIAQARWEYYETPAALPTTQPGTISKDLWRRDFTINALALSLSEPFFGRLLDPFGGLSDLKKRILRIHHLLSFIDDPTRIFRAARYATRLNLELSLDTRKALSLAIKCKILDRLSPSRIRQEFWRIFGEEDPAAALLWLGRKGILAALFGGEEPPLETLVNLSTFKPFLDSKALLEALGLILSPSIDGLEKIGLPKERAQKLLRELKDLETKKSFLFGPAPLSKKVFFLEKFSEGALAAAGVRNQALLTMIKDFLTRYRNLRPRLSGKDLQKAGIPPGPKLGEMLKRLRAARLDGLVKNHEEEWAFLKKEFPDVFST